MAWDVDAWNEERERLRESEEAARRKQLRLRELIIVGVAVALLALVLLPIFRKKNDRDLALMSAQNLMQWGIALNLYLIENDNAFPEAGPDQMDPALADAWYNALPPYLSQEPLSALPKLEVNLETPSLWVDPGVDPATVPRFQNFPFFYAMNRFLQPDPALSSYRIFDVQNPGAVIFLTEVLGVDPGVLPDGVTFRHGREEPKAHVLFCDGHVELVSRTDLVETPEATEPEAELAPVSWAPYVGAAAPGIAHQDG